MTIHDKNDVLASLTLGKATEYQSNYNPDLLQAIPRSLNREELDIVEKQPFVGSDVWHAYEMSWLNLKGKPVVALGRFIIASDTPNIIESKSFKLYLNSFNQSQFDSMQAVESVLQQDLSVKLNGNVTIELIAPDDNNALPVSSLSGICIDDLDIEVTDFALNPTLLRCESQETVVETLHSHLLKSNCLITDQPDWASVVISYEGGQIDHTSLLKYLISFRLHNEFHEQCVERIYMDILKQCQPKRLSVQAFYTRRGGLDINPYRASDEGFSMPLIRVNRQ